MNPRDAKLTELKTAARAAGRDAATKPTEHERSLELIGAYGRNLRAAHDETDLERFGWDGQGLAALLNTITTKAFEAAEAQRVTYEVEILHAIGNGLSRISTHVVQGISRAHAEQLARRELRDRLIAIGHLDPESATNSDVDTLNVFKVNMSVVADGGPVATPRLTTPDVARGYVANTYPDAVDFQPVYPPYGEEDRSLIGHTFRDRYEPEGALYGWVTVDGQVDPLLSRDRSSANEALHTMHAIDAPTSEPEATEQQKQDKFVQQLRERVETASRATAPPEVTATRRRMTTQPVSPAPDAQQAAQELAELINRMEAAGLHVALSNGGHVDVHGMTVKPGMFEGDPWTVES